MSQSWEWNGAGVMGHMTYSPFVDALSDCSMSGMKMQSSLSSGSCRTVVCSV